MHSALRTILVTVGATVALAVGPGVGMANAVIPDLGLDGIVDQVTPVSAGLDLGLGVNLGVGE